MLLDALQCRTLARLCRPTYRFRRPRTGLYWSLRSVRHDEAVARLHSFSEFGWLPMPERVDGFAQTHVSGTGGGPKYGNILFMPYCGNPASPQIYAYRESETILPAYYSSTFKDSGITTEITASDRTAAYRFHFPAGSDKGLKIDAGFFLGESPTPDAREAQQFVGSEIQILSDHEVSGYSRIRGGWNNGRAYTVYFYAVADTPFADAKTFKGSDISSERQQYDSVRKPCFADFFPAMPTQLMSVSAYHSSAR